ncbi:MAG: TolC family protein [Planctomycetes bacterium]|nr:TolC family protein [Planctomycetota bacterium]
MARRVAALLGLVGGCATPDGGPSMFSTAPQPPAALARQPSRPGPGPRPAPAIQPANFQTPALLGQPAEPAPITPAGLEDFIRLAVERNPRLARATLAIDAARGRHLQAGLYPNPDVAFAWDEIGDRTSIAGSGIITAPRVTQTIVTGRKLTLAQAVAAREVDQAALELIAERYAVVGSVRAAFYEALTLQRRAEILAELVKLSEEAVAGGKTLLDAQRIARLDYIQLEVERERFRAELQAVRRELPGAYRRLSAVAGAPAVIPPAVTGSFDGLPDYDADAVREAVLFSHPQVRSARVGVDRAQAAVRRAEVEPIPNVTVYAGFIRQFENRSYDGTAGLSAPVPVWNRNQGNIRAAKAELGMAIQAVGQAENELAARVAAAIQTYAAARERAELYRKELLPRAEETYKLSLAAFKGGQFEYLRVIQAQRAAAEARLELNRSLGEAWRAAAELSGLLLEEWWPGPQPAPPGPGAGPVMMPPPAPKDVKGP